MSIYFIEQSSNNKNSDSSKIKIDSIGLSLTILKQFSRCCYVEMRLTISENLLFLN